MSECSQFELFGFWRSSATYRVRVALNLKNMNAEEMTIDLDAGQQRTPEFLKVNPLGALPTLIEAGQQPLTQSIAILEYLEELQPDPPLLPSDLQGRARVRSIASMLTADTHPLVVPRVKNYLMERGGFDLAAWRDWQIQWFGTGIRAVEKRLATEAGTGIWCHGDSPTFADIALASIIAVMRVFQISIPNTPTVDRIIAQCDLHEAFLKAAPYRQIGAPPVPMHG
ncbi:maleylacetoacetate isomerase [Paraburkholderia sp. SARCC-3016]|uniref:maleylacetoacetate isomerase n=1 Tax=Paraburkholderia sp. SARCC-3016 TaxID=3058611 RepID=UPI00280810B8|nr:maleylacetoacetate isomerase [Paraburkholderia sp. SARCC-3016]MDQ7978561.1 maleylacetoacetate isomerase [Paraburkholderia sp. SARCC-3016]